MSAILADEEILEKAIAGVSRVAERIAFMPPENRDTALAAAEASYYRTALELGHTELLAQAWAANVMAGLRAEVGKRVKAKVHSD